ncbi:histidine kinase [Pedobacter polaris]|uniref:Histidine kinase n=1 Tax=Pedobacter polaris TaxID=2571273 RepID=A0A4U1CEA0_9SPHI|nr:histidine kinase [Pedobacter polaris]TKC04627.1 histidine kinase [Pedobacter polaris]
MKKTTINYLHVGYWLLVLVQTLLVSLGTGVLGTTFDWRLFSQIVLPVKFLQVLSSAIFFYINYLFLIPVFLKKGNVIKYLPSLIATLLIFTPLYYFLEQRLYPMIGWKSYDADLNFWFAVMITLSSNFINIFLAILLSYLMDWRTMRIQKEIIEKEQFKTELAFLKSQVNPHYLFNTINDIYALTQQQSAEAPNALLKLSELLRYMLRESDDQFVPLSKEIIYLENVIELQKIGQKGLSFVNFEVVGEVNKLKIAPLILINFVENAFKHGTFNKKNNPINILIIIHEQLLHFQISNQINHVKKDKTGGIGLVNVKRRLSLIYPEKHELTIHQLENEFIVDLKIALYD